MVAVAPKGCCVLFQYKYLVQRDFRSSDERQSLVVCKIKMKPSDEQCLEVCKFCVNYLNEKYSFEKNLFRSGVSQTDVRTLQAQLIQQTGSNKIRNEPDPHLTAEVLITTLKDMRFPLFFEVYDDVLSTGKSLS